MGNLKPAAFDIETNGLDTDSVITVAGIALELGEIQVLNTGGRDVVGDKLQQHLSEYSTGRVKLATVSDEQELLETLQELTSDHLDDDRYYLTAYHGETWNGGFDLPFVRTACVKHDVDWPFPNLAYADVLDIVDRFETHDKQDLVGVYKELVGKESCDPFDDSESAVDAFEAGQWKPLLLHNLADIQRTRELAVIASSYVPQSDFRMKNLDPPQN